MIIDIHMHIGDILHIGGGNSAYKNTSMPNSMNIQRFEEECLKFNSFPITKFFFEVFDDRYTLSVQNRIKAGNLSNYTIYKALLMETSTQLFGDNCVKSCCMPVAPYVTYDDVLSIATSHHDILPFTSINPDYSAEEIYYQIGANIKSCYGLKLHPIIQGIPFDSEKVFSAVEALKKSNKPVLFHAGASRYYLGEEKYLQSCELDDPNAAKRLIDRFPDVKFIIGHAGIAEYQEWASIFRNYENVYFDITVQSVTSIKKLIQLYGEDKMLFATDWPCVNPSITICIVKKALTLTQKEKCFYGNALCVLGISANEIRGEL